MNDALAVGGWIEVVVRQKLKNFSTYSYFLQLCIDGRWNRHDAAEET
jgi:hypothetical protein